MSEPPDPDATPPTVEEGEAQRYLEHENPDAERERAGLGDRGRETEPLPDERRDAT